MGKRYGFCKATSRWVPRDEMVGASLKVFRYDGSVHRIPLRFSREGMDSFVEMVSKNEWENQLMEEDELEDHGLLAR
jgi:hypothetical protein